MEFGDHVQKEMSVLFCDIRSFTELSESMTPEDNFKFLNSFYSQMGPVIRMNQGFIDKYIGDAIMALFDRNADHAVRAAVEMMNKLEEYNQKRTAKGYAPVRIGIGINTGELMLGTIGEMDRMEGTVISDAVNIASRVESLTKVYGSSIMITDQTYGNLRDPSLYLTRFIDRVIVKGKSKAITVMEVFDGDPLQMKEAKKQTSRAFEEAVDLYFSRSFEEAVRLFRGIFEKNPADRAAEIYIERCEHYLKFGWDEGWDLSATKLQ